MVLSEKVRELLSHSTINIFGLVMNLCEAILIIHLLNISEIKSPYLLTPLGIRQLSHGRSAVIWTGLATYQLHNFLTSLN
jgi:phosphoribulokinase